MNEQVTRDLMKKIGDDVSAAMHRTLAISPDHLPVAMAAGATVLAIVSAILDTEQKPTPDADCLLLAGLLIARTGFGGIDTIGEAYEDFDVLKRAGRTLGAVGGPSRP